MKKIVIILLIIIIIGLGFYFYKQNSTINNISSSNYTAEKTSTNQENNIITNSIDSNINIEQNTNTSTEDKLSDFSTKLPVDTKARYSNISLACETLNDTVVKAGDTFSLWNTLGCPTKEKGYRKAKSFTSDGKIKKSFSLYSK